MRSGSCQGNIDMKGICFVESDNKAQGIIYPVSHRNLRCNLALFAM